MKNVHKFENLGQSDLLLSVCLDLVSMYICVKYDGSVINYICRRETEKWLSRYHLYSNRGTRCQDQFLRGCLFSQNQRTSIVYEEDSDYEAMSPEH